ncbi:MAG: farnesyl-diphosphate synthase [Cyanobacteria bacterium RYN_339]|nr:farnesyl-diphosphate synthase [Cyanobacteria bacterium RYN_339]
MPPAAAFDLPTYWQAWRVTIEGELDRLSAHREPAKLWDAMRYSLQAGGKRVRPLLTVATLEALGRDPRPALPAACAVELIHTQSLIHDDLPAMDDDDLRRGKPTNHKVFGEANAILAGDAMLAHAFVLLAAELTPAYRPELALAAIRELAEATVAMVSGQVVDIESEGQAVAADVLEYIHRHKTGALIRAAVRLGGILGEASADDMQRLGAYAEELGLAFQIADDILDGTKTAEELGKTPGKDQDAGKATYVTLYGLAEARRRLAEARERALAPLAGWGERATALGAIVGYVVDQVA